MAGKRLRKMNSSDAAVVGPGFRNGTLTLPHVIEGDGFFLVWFGFWFCVCVAVKLYYRH